MEHRNDGATRDSAAPPADLAGGHGRKRGVVGKVVGGWWSLVSMPYRRAATDLRRSWNEVGNAFDEIGRRREEKRRELEVIDGYLQEASPAERFAQYYEVNGWTEPELANQQVAARRTRRALVLVGAVGFACIATSLVFLPILIVIVAGPVAVVFLAACFVQALRCAWYEFQLQGRVCIPLKQFLGRPDLFRRVLG